MILYTTISGLSGGAAAARTCFDYKHDCSDRKTIWCQIQQQHVAHATSFVCCLHMNHEPNVNTPPHNNTALSVSLQWLKAKRECYSSIAGHLGLGTNLYEYTTITIGWPLSLLVLIAPDFHEGNCRTFKTSRQMIFWEGVKSLQSEGCRFSYGQSRLLL